MSEQVKVDFDKVQDQAVLLLAAAAELDLPPTVVQTTTGAFLVPAEVAEKAFEDKKPAAKKTATKKSEG